MHCTSTRENHRRNAPLFRRDLLALQSLFFTVCHRYQYPLGQQRRQTFDHQRALLKYPNAPSHAITVYDMHRTAKQQCSESNGNEHICPALTFESRFEGGNLQQVKRV